MEILVAVTFERTQLHSTPAYVQLVIQSMIFSEGEHGLRSDILIHATRNVITKTLMGSDFPCYNSVCEVNGDCGQ